MNYNKRSNDTSWGTIILMVVTLIIFICVINSCSISGDREKQHMVQIYDSENLVYNQDTMIVYREEIIHGKSVDTATYSIYYNENGNKCKYINGEFFEIENSSE